MLYLHPTKNQIIMIENFKNVVLKNYANFNGRARRSEYWYFVLAQIILAIIAMIIDSTLGLNIAPLPYGYTYFIVAFGLFLPGLAVFVRRLHDTGKSGWWILIYFTIIGIFYLLYLLVIEGDEGANEYGPNPKGIGNDEIAEIGKFQE